MKFSRGEETMEPGLISAPEISGHNRDFYYAELLFFFFFPGVSE